MKYGVKPFKSSIDSIIKAQKRAVKIVCKVILREHTNVLISELRMLKFQDLVNYKISINMYNASLKLLLPNVQRHFCKKPFSVYSLRNNSKFKLLRARTTVKSFCLCIYGVKFFNNLPENITSAKKIYIILRYMYY